MTKSIVFGCYMLSLVLMVLQDSVLANNDGDVGDKFYVNYFGGVIEFNGRFILYPKISPDSVTIYPSCSDISENEFCPNGQVDFVVGNVKKYICELGNLKCDIVGEAIVNGITVREYRAVLFKKSEPIIYASKRGYLAVFYGVERGVVLRLLESMKK